MDESDKKIVVNLPCSESGRYQLVNMADVWEGLVQVM